MKLYFLLEGVGSEMQAYPSWMKKLLPTLEIFNNTEEFNDFMITDNSAYFISGEGYPSLLTKVESSIKDIEAVKNVDYFFVILDSDDESLEVRQKAVLDQCKKHDISRNIKVCVIVQKRCFETLILRNQRYIPRHPEPNPEPNMESFWDLFQYYNVHVNDPEDMGNYNDRYTHSQFHAHYAKKALWEKKIIYTKGKIGVVAQGDFILGIKNRALIF